MITKVNLLEKLKVSKIYKLLFHTSKDLNSNQEMKLINTVSKLKQQGEVQKIGVSVYEPKEPKMLSEIFNRRFEKSSWLNNGMKAPLKYILNLFFAMAY